MGHSGQGLGREMPRYPSVTMRLCKQRLAVEYGALYVNILEDFESHDSSIG